MAKWCHSPPFTDGPVADRVGRGWFDEGAMVAAQQPIKLSPVEESLLVPLYARALDAQSKRPIVNDPRAVEIVRAIDWDFGRFNQKRRIIGCALRTAVFDEFVRKFLARHPQGTVVEIGAGLNTRFERVDNGAVHWFDIDLPEAMTLRRRFFANGERRTSLAASVVDTDWMDAVRQSPAPYFFIAETVFVYLPESQVKAALAQIARSFPGAGIAFDTATFEAIARENADHARLNLGAHFASSCEDPKEIERWGIGLRLVESLTLADFPKSVRRRLPLTMRIGFRYIMLRHPKKLSVYRLNLFAAERAAQQR
jgi:O-methyltransferase involved in polyketide biosynthesis